MSVDSLGETENPFHNHEGPNLAGPPLCVRVRTAGGLGRHALLFRVVAHLGRRIWWVVLVKRSSARLRTSWTPTNGKLKPLCL